MDARREYTLTLCGLAGGGALALAAAQAGWVVATSSEVGYDTAFHGTEVAPAVVACALVALAGAVGVIATRGIGRRIVGVVLALVGLVVVATSVAVVIDPRSAVRHPLSLVAGGGSGTAPHVVSFAWWWCLLAVLGGFAVLGGAVLTAVRGTRWPVMAARYDAPSGARRAATPDAWTQLDRGEDPTVDPGTATSGPDLAQSPQE
jgi:uncharacterized membrane protein (TIGR02234 family)